MNTFRRGASAYLSVSGRDCVAVPAVRAQRAPLRALRAATSSAWLLFCLLLVSAVSARAATFDIAAGDVAGLKAAINTANGNGEADTINLAANATYTLTTVDNSADNGSNGLPRIMADGAASNSVSINGNGASIVRSSAAGTPDFRIFLIDPRGTLNASGLTLSGGRAVGSDGNDQSGYGGAIDAEGTLVLTGSTVSGNFANNGGGGLNNYGTIRLASCTIANNICDSQGGGLYQEDGTGTLENCTISGNTVINGGDGGGGGIVNASFSGNTSRLTLDSCTFNNNKAVNAGIALSNLSPGGALGRGTPLSTYRNTIFAGSTGGPNVFSNAGSITSLGYNISSDASGNLTQPTDKSNTDPRLAPLANNGGPTQTHALQSGSPAIDAGNSPFTTDQRGRVRPFDFAGVANAQGGNGSDIGAYELDAPQSGTSFVVNQTTDTDDGSCGATDCTLREAINAANVAGGTITFDATVFASKQTIKLGSQLPNVNQTTTITGSAAGVTIDAAGNNILYSIAPSLTLRALNFINGGAATVNNFRGDMLVEGCAFFNNGRALITGNTMTVRNTTVSGSSTAIGISSGGTATVESCTLANNILGVGAGPDGGTVNLSNSILANNSQGNIDPTLTVGTNSNNVDVATLAAAGLDPAGIKDNGGPVPTIALLAGSQAIDKGTGALATDARGLPRPVDLPGVSNGAGNGSDIGAFEKQDASGFASGPNFVVTNIGDTDNGCTATNCSLREAINAANGDGDTSEITFDATVFAARQTISTQTGFPNLGSNISISGPTTPGAGVTLSQPNNVGGGRIGSVLLVTGGTVNLTNLTFTSGGNNIGVQNTNGGSNLTVRGCTFADNSTGLYFNSGTTTVSNCTFSGNTDTGIFAVTNCSIDSSTLSGNNTGLFVADGAVTVSNTIIAGNNTNVNTGAGFGTLNDAGFNILTGTAAQAGLGPLKDNGGPTFTFALLAGSPAINAGDPNFDGTGQFDQRGPGFARVKRGRLDIGAFESPFPNSAPVLNNRTFTTAVNAPFSQQLTATDADGDALTYTLANGTTLPAGLRLTRRGVIAGTPTMAGRTDFSVAVNDGIATTIAKFIIIVSSANDGIGPVITRNAVSSPTTRDALASSSLSGTIRDIAQRGVTPSGVSRVLVQLRDSAGNAYSGGRDGFTTNVNRGYYAATLGAPRGGVPGGARTFTRNLSWIPADLAPGDYTLVISGQDVAGNYSVEVVPVTVVAAQSSRAATSSGSSALRAPAPGGSGGEG